MAKSVHDRGAQGSGSIVFRQKIDYPSKPNHITYYPPEPSDELKKKVVKEKAGGITIYIIGFIVTLMGFWIAMDTTYDLSVYSVLIPVALILGLIFAIMFLVIGNVSLAKLARLLPKILVVALILLFIMSIFQAFNDIQSIGDGPQEPDDGASPQEWQNYNATREQFEEEMRGTFDSLANTIINPAFFIMIIGLFIAGAGGNMLVSSTQILHDYTPGMIIIETPGQELHETEQEQYACQNCGGTLTYVQEYDRWYCYDCKTYAPKAEDAAPQETQPEPEQTTLEDMKFCATCSDQLVFIDQYQKNYCYNCKEYASDDIPAAEAQPIPLPAKVSAPAPVAEPEEEGKPTAVCPECGGELKLIERYNRWYCYKCKKYA